MTIQRILIIEDEPAIALALEDMVESLGWTSAGIASRLDQGLLLVERCLADVAILDVNLHGERSYPIADALADRGVPYVFATGYGDTEHPERHRHSVTLTKPYSIADIELAVTAAVRERVGAAGY